MRTKYFNAQRVKIAGKDMWVISRVSNYTMYKVERGISNLNISSSYNRVPKKIFIFLLSLN